MEMLLKNVRPIVKALHYLDLMKLIEEDVMKEESSKIRQYAEAAFRSMKRNGIIITGKQAHYYRSGIPYDIPIEDFQRYAVQDRIIASRKIPQDLTDLANILFDLDRKKVDSNVRDRGQFLARYLTTNERMKIASLNSLSEYDAQIENETKIIQLLKILIKVDCRAQHDPSVGAKIIEPLKKLCNDKEGELEIQKRGAAERKKQSA
ncbi:hypothetical protein PGTUg99_022564 [Puccinia graminis f. sp. tritici]|uniref:Uncharacterized protein n=1 Tax=Puccinia graminis f. sp. tritici TaxID=56615 RepID=A0A5B0RY94_PUCGR|nr:hypothetical protein PGTUg99_022564 [Puccinia graminis f. sp. tritici]